MTPARRDGVTRPAAALAGVVVLAALVLAVALLARPSGEALPPEAGGPPGESRAPATPSFKGTPESTRFVNAELGYSIELPLPWRRSDCFSGSFGSGEDLHAQDVFVVVREYDETSGHIGLPHDHVIIASWSNPEGLSPRGWYESERRAIADDPTEVTFADRSALRLSPEYYLVSDGTRMFEVSGQAGVDSETTAEARLAVIQSFRFLPPDELQAIRAEPTPSPPPPRSPEEVADVLAEGFERKDVALLATVITEECMGLGVASGGRSAMNEQRYLDELRDRFAAGLEVDVRPRPITITGGRIGGPPWIVIGSTWREPGRPDLEVDLMISRERGEQWVWRGNIEFLSGRE